MHFKDFLNEIKTPDDLQMRYNVRKSTSFYIDDNGFLQLGTGDIGSFNPYFTLNPEHKTIMAHNIEPTTKQFKDAIKLFQKYIPDINNWNVDVLGLSHAKSGKIGHAAWKFPSGDISKRYGELDRQVSYYMNHPNTDITPADMPQYLYHGTSTELWYSGIKTQGLLPRNKSKYGNAGSYGAGGALSKEDLVHLAVHPDPATREASIQAANQHGGQPLILKISTKGLDLSKFTYDDDAERQFNRTEKYRKEKNIKMHSKQALSSRMMGTVAYKGRIPSTLIEPFLLGQMNQTKSTIYYTWTKFKDVERETHPLTKKLNSSYESEYNHFSSSDNPYFFALVDADILKEKENNHGYYVAKPVTDEEVRKIITSSPWVRDAYAISKWEYHNSPLSQLNYAKRHVNDLKHQKIIDILVQSKLFREEGKYIKSDYWHITLKAIKLAKLLYENNLKLNDVITFAKFSTQQN